MESEEYMNRKSRYNREEGEVSILFFIIRRHSERAVGPQQSSDSPVSAASSC